MRIIGGVAAGRLLKVPKGLSVRPTPDLVRQAVFNSLGGRVTGARVLDLFSGSGALGLECLSRGAAEVISIERSGRHAAFIQENRVAVGLSGENYELRVQDVFTVLHRLAAEQRQFDLILADPPFGEKNVGRRSDSFSQALLDQVQLPQLLVGPGGLFVLGHARRDTLTVPPVWEVVKELRHGDSVMKVLKRAAGP